MSEYRVTLQRAVELNRSVRPGEAYECVVNVLDTASTEQLLQLEPLLAEAIASFLPKRRRALAQHLNERLSDATSDGSKVGAEGALLVQPASEDSGGAISRSVEPSTAPPLRSSDEWASASSPEQQDAEQLLNVGLASVQRLVRAVRLDEAEDLFLKQLASLSPYDVVRYRDDLLKALNGFFPKRRLPLIASVEKVVDKANRQSARQDEIAKQTVTTSDLVERSVETSIPPESESGAIQPKPAPPSRGTKPQPVLDYNRKRFNEDLDWLSRWHIFKWNTQYRDTLSEYFDTYLDDLSDPQTRDRERPILDLIRSALSNHSREIFTKGYHYSLTSLGLDERDALAKSLGGLRRFLDIPIEIYSAKLAGAHQNDIVRPLRQLTSAMLFGIASGYNWADVGHANVLSDSPEAWCYALPFFSYRDIQELVGHLSASSNTLGGVRNNSLPLAEAVDTFIEKQPTVAPLPALSEYSIAERRVDVSLHLAPSMSTSRQLYVRCYLTAEEPKIADFEDAAARQYCIVLANISGETRAHIENVERLSDMVISTSGSSDTDICGRIISVLDDAIYEERANAGPTRPILSNPAREFPVENPFLAKYQHVYRKSVRQLMSTFEQRKGVRLWCSVRRSGKTTACAKDLGSASDDSLYLAQTCSSTGQIDSGDVFYKAVSAALRDNTSLSEDFVIRTLRDCIDGTSATDKRLIVVLDEYELLFGYLRASLRRSPELRYTVVQPLLDQLVAFARENLLVFMGQQPAAHYIMMDQNQLSPMVVQDSFPLFTHDPRAPLTTEFYQLLRKILRTSSELDPDFVDAAYGMTGGHPYLTVNLIVALFDWMIEASYPRSSINPLTAETFEKFVANKLTSKFIARGDHFALFKNAAMSALSSEGRDSNAWLHSVYSVLRVIHLESPNSHALTETEFETAVSKNCPTIDAQDLLGTAIRSNFLMQEGELIKPRIEILSRIAGAVTTGLWL